MFTHDAPGDYAIPGGSALEEMTPQTLAHVVEAVQRKLLIHGLTRLASGRSERVEVHLVRDVFPRDRTSAWAPERPRHLLSVQQIWRG
jgi:hypothetical protein